MFSRKVINNQFCSDIGDKLFPNITADVYAGGDFSLTTVLRALLGNRTNDRVHARILVQQQAEAVNFQDEGGLTIVELPDNPDSDAVFAIDMLKTNVGEQMPGFTEHAALEKFFKESQKKETAFFLNKEKRQAVIYFHGLNVRYLHLLCSFIPTLLPWYFEENPVVRKSGPVLDPQAWDLLEACAGGNASNFENAVGVLYDRYDFREAIINAKLEGFETKFHEVQLDNIRIQMDGIRSEMERYRERIATLYRELDEKTTMEAGLIQKIKTGEEGGSEIRDLFLAYKNLHLESVDNTAITFVVDTVINNFNPEIFDITVRNERSFWYRTEGGQRYSRAWTDKQIEKFIRAVFEEEILKIKVCAAYRLDLSSGRFAGMSHFSFGPEFADSMPNMHIQQYACLGSGHERQLHDAMSRRDYVGAINVCVASAGNMSMEEVPTGERHMKYLLGDNPGKCVILPDGRNVTPLEAIKWLEEQEPENGGNENE